MFALLAICCDCYLQKLFAISQCSNMNITFPFMEYVTPSMEWRWLRADCDAVLIHLLISGLGVYLCVQIIPLWIHASNLCVYRSQWGNFAGALSYIYPCFVSQVLWESISDTICHILHENVQWVCMMVLSYTGWLLLVLLLILHAHNKTDGNKLMILSVWDKLLTSLCYLVAWIYTSCG